MKLIQMFEPKKYGKLGVRMPRLEVKLPLVNGVEQRIIVSRSLFGTVGTVSQPHIPHTEESC